MASRKALSLLLVVVAGLCLICGNVQALGVASDPCTTDNDCGQGLYCFSCDGASPVCAIDSATPVSSFSQNYSLPFNKYAWVTTHNAYAIVGETSILGVTIVSQKNQEDSITSQLNKGVRGLMLDIYELNGDIWLCHSVYRQCYDFTAFRPLNTTLIEIEAFLTANPTEVITIFFEDYVNTTNALTTALTATGLSKYMFPLAKMPTDGSDWPTVSSMITSNERLLVFTSNRNKQAGEGIAYQWNYVLENQYGTVALTCDRRGESALLTDKTKTLFLQNYFPTNPNRTTACLDNSDNLSKALNVCSSATGNRWANFLAVDYYQRSTSKGVFKAVDTLNGQLQCGCEDIRACEGSTGPGICSVVTAPVATPRTPPPPSPPTALPPGTPSSAGALSSSFSALVVCLAMLLVAHSTH
ncbi:hypothetical protein M758_1G175400 [Ceratodon purpureus]|uniref:Phosphatidylinositol-specific phospholipase C X domain-containing protein n=1 Tax=Ceratodon purpureus TaxID=3225 RepID=A0A8T0J996_CERPU|nr:hypothetical protein KC19_1G178600 [Ceratodon purpureus]KAG0591484.1 hypothetical protein KC19_1G178600 [Ceratodon purpureus]KAG0630394.1 hypothetical protein M758_1G175400 [Ceratodon purpureus]KAG0630395.1 hypothetical protein M758_1G175400 [Ceratodon purpureus]